MALDVKKWLIEEMGFSEAEAAEIAPKYTAERAAKLESGYVAANDRAAVAAARQDIDSAKAELKAANDRLNAEIAEWATMTAAEKAQSTELRDSLHASQAEVLRLQQTVQSVAAQAGIDPSTVLPKAEVKVPVETKPTIDTSKFVNTDHFSTLMSFMADLPAQLQYIAEQHKELTGKTLDTRTIVAEVKKRAGQKDAVVDPVKIWEDMHNIPTVRADRDKATREAEIAAAEQRGEERARTNLAIPGASTTRSARPSPVLGQRANDGHMAARTSVLKRPQPETGVNAAAAAFRSGKYRASA